MPLRLAIYRNFVRKTCYLKRRYHSTLDSHVFCNFLTKHEIGALNDWSTHPPSRILSDHLSTDHLRDLYSTLPTRDGLRSQPFKEPKIGDQIPYGHHLAFFHPRVAEGHLREDGTEADLSPPAPFTTRMWVGGSIKWDCNRPLITGREANSISDVARVETKGYEEGKPMLFVTQGIRYVHQGESEPSITEERTHVYLHSRFSSQNKKVMNRPVKELPGRVDFSLNYTPSPVTLFRYSALTFNAHSIHLDKEYCQLQGYPERLVHGPLTAQILLEAVYYWWPSKFLSFTYRARNPIFVKRRQTINATMVHDHGKWLVHVWCRDDDGVIGMTGSVEIGLY